MNDAYKSKSKHGGTRPGAGRPSIKATRVDITLRPDQIEWLKSKGNMSEVIRELVDREIQANPT